MLLYQPGCIHGRDIRWESCTHGIPENCITKHSFSFFIFATFTFVLPIVESQYYFKHRGRQNNPKNSYTKFSPSDVSKKGVPWIISNKHAVSSNTACVKKFCMSVQHGRLLIYAFPNSENWGSLELPQFRNIVRFISLQ